MAQSFAGSVFAHLLFQSMSQKIKVLSFDLDDTLWPCLPVIERAEDLLYSWLSEHVPVITQHYDKQQLREKRQALLIQKADIAHDLTRLRILSFEQLAEEFELTTAWIRPAFDIYYEARQQVTLFDDVAPVLDTLTKDYRLVSVTNGNADTVKTGVDHWFEFALSSASVGRSKSEPYIYKQVQKLADIKPRQMIHIGDHPLHDISGAKSAGVFAIWLNREAKSWVQDDCAPDATITSLLELPVVLKQFS